MKSRFTFYTMICVATLALCLFSSGHTWADPPQHVVLSYNPGTQTLTADIDHKTFFTGLHYVKQIEIKKNNQPVSKHDFTKQPGKTNFSYNYRVPAMENDLLEVTASCNIQGQKTATLKVEAQKN